MLSVHVKRWGNKNDFTDIDIVLCLKWQCFLNSCKLKRQTTTMRYSVAIIVFFADEGPFVHSFSAWRHKFTPKAIAERFVLGTVVSLDK